MTRSTLVSLVVTLACSCRPTLASRLRDDGLRPMPSMAALAAEQDAMLAQQRACRAKRSQTFTESEVQAIGERARAKWLAGRTTRADARLSRIGGALRTHLPARAW